MPGIEDIRARVDTCKTEVEASAAGVNELARTHEEILGRMQRGMSLLSEVVTLFGQAGEHNENALTAYESTVDDHIGKAHAAIEPLDLLHSQSKQGIQIPVAVEALDNPASDIYTAFLQNKLALDGYMQAAQRLLEQVTTQENRFFGARQHLESQYPGKAALAAQLCELYTERL